MKDIKLKKIFEKTLKVSKENHKLNNLLWFEVEKYLGFDPDPMKLDSLIDSIEQGISDLDYDSFVSILKKYKEEHFKNE